jgi:penicillin amidase
VGFFERPDPRLIEIADPTPAGAIGRALRRHGVALVICLAAALGAYAVDVETGLRESAVTRGTITMHGLFDRATIVRDRRDIPHIRARNEHDLYFAEGYAEGSDRLFQLDLTRRYAYGRLAEVLGPKAVPYDLVQRAVDIDGIAQRQLRALARSDRTAIAAFSAGVNAAAATQPLPVEFRLLRYRPALWTPKDSLAVSIVASLELADSWQDVFARDAAWRQSGAQCFAALYPLSDTRYDVTVDGARDALPTQRPANACDASDVAALPNRRPTGSNAWAAGARRSVDGHALLANDPHLDLTIPGIWYVVDLESPQLHAAGATIPGIPGIVLGHNERVAWASTNADMATTSVFDAGRLHGGSWVTERFGVRFSRAVSARYYRTAREFSVAADDADPKALAFVRWPIYAQTRSTIATGLALARARDVRDALRILARYRGSPQNFILADRSGAVAYHVAGLVPNDPAWGRYVHPASDLRETFAPIPFARLPQRTPARDAVLVSANNKAYGREYPYRLSAQFEPPYRAYRIAQLLRAQSRYDVDDFSRMQLDTLSPIDLEIARDLVRIARAHPADDEAAQALRLLAHWDGRYRPNSRGAALEHAVRAAVFGEGSGFDPQLAALRDDSGASLGLKRDLLATLPYVAVHDRRAWGDAGRIRIEYLLSPLHFTFLDGAWLPGEGDEYTIHLQEPGLAQGFRAVWNVGDWDRGGIAIPSGESGEPGSGHYTDLTRDWVDGVLRPLPFSAAAVARNVASVLVLRPYEIRP